MHSQFKKSDDLTAVVIGAAMEVHRLKGPGLLESIYQKCMTRELELQGLSVECEVAVPVEYKGLVFDDHLRVDLWVDRCLVVELKAVERVLPIHKAQVLSYMRLLNAPLGLLINFHEITLKQGVHRLIVPGSDAVDVDF
jgi:GxxExxY protein